MTSNIHIVTGTTGFVGAALTAELLKQCNDEIIVIVRPNETNSAHDRFLAAFRAAAAAYELDKEIMSAAEKRCRVIAGDVVQELCGVSGLESQRVTQFWHCAASLRYEDRYQQEIYDTNILGTQNALALAQRLGAKYFNYVSTAYVAGKSIGLVEEKLHADIEANNYYERSKTKAEHLVMSSGLHTRILRPSIVIGHSQTLAATNFTGFYGFLRQLVQFKGMMERAEPGLLSTTPLCLRVDPDIGLNLIPVDFVTRQAVALGLSDATEGIYHLTYPAPPQVGKVIEIFFREVGLPNPIFVSDRKGNFTWLDKKLDERLDFYGSYIMGEKHFDRSRTDEVLACLGYKEKEIVFDDRLVTAYARWYLACLEKERANLPVGR